MDATWGRWDGDIVVDDSQTEQTVTGSFPWAYSENPTTTDELSDVFSAPGTLSYGTMSGPSPVGTVNGDSWTVSNLSVDMSIGGGTADINTGDVVLDLTGPGSLEVLENLNSMEGTATIDPSNGDRSFVVSLEGSSGEDTGVLQAGFAGDSADGMLVNFTAEDFDYSGGPLQEVISGVKILEQQ